MTDRAKRRRQLRDMESLRAPEGLPSDATLDTLGLYCPIPIIRTAESILKLAPGDTLEVLSDDRVILIDMPAWCVANGHEYLGYRDSPEGWRLYVRRR